MNTANNPEVLAVVPLPSPEERRRWYRLFTRLHLNTDHFEQWAAPLR